MNASCSFTALARLSHTIATIFQGPKSSCHAGVNFDLASSYLRIPGPGHKERTSKSELQNQTQHAAGHVHLTVTASSKSRLDLTSHVAFHPAYGARPSKSPTFHRRPSLSITIVRTRSGSGSVPITAASAAVRPRSPRSPRRAEHGARCTRSLRCRTRDSKHSRAHPASPPVGVLEDVVRRPSTVAV